MTSRNNGLEKPFIRQAVLNVSYSCNLNCRNCLHFCDLNYVENTPDDEKLDWLKTWSGLIEPGVLGLMGGEPLLNPRLPDYIRAAAEYFPQSRRVLVTNGLVLDRWKDDLADLLRETGTSLSLSLYSLKPSLKARQDRAAARLTGWRESRGLEATFADYRDPAGPQWINLFFGHGADLRPANSPDPELSLFRCRSTAACRPIHGGRLWACPPLAFLPLAFPRLTHKNLWEPFLDYKPLSPGFSAEEFVRFAAGPPARFCAMCRPRPTTARAMALHPSRQNEAGSVFSGLSEAELGPIMDSWAEASQKGLIRGYGLGQAAWPEDFLRGEFSRPTPKIFYDQNPALQQEPPPGLTVLGLETIAPEAGKIVIFNNSYDDVKRVLTRKGLLEGRDFLPHHDFWAWRLYFHNRRFLFRKVMFLSGAASSLAGYGGDDLERDVKEFFRRVHFVRQVTVAGGGPGLADFLNFIQKEYGRRIGQTKLLTDGEARPDERTLRACEDYEIMVSLSDRREGVDGSPRLDGLIDLLDSRSIYYQIICGSPEELTHRPWEDSLTPGAALNKCRKCAKKRWTPVFVRGRYYFCAQSFWAAVEGLCSVAPEESFDFASGSDWELVWAGLGSRRMAAPAWCAHCRGYDD